MRYLLGEGRIERARANFLPIAYNPHGGPQAEHARTVIERIDAGTAPDADELRTIFAAAAPAEDGSAGEGGD